MTTALLPFERLANLLPGPKGFGVFYIQLTIWKTLRVRTISPARSLS
jgi:hypothetical protein